MKAIKEKENNRVSRKWERWDVSRAANYYQRKFRGTAVKETG